MSAVKIDLYLRSPYLKPFAFTQTSDLKLKLFSIRDKATTIQCTNWNQDFQINQIFLLRLHHLTTRVFHQ